MNDINRHNELPFAVKISFNKLLSQYEAMVESENDFLASKAKHMIDIQKPYPELREGFSDLNVLDKRKHVIDTLFSDLFSQVLTQNEIKTASAPLLNVLLKTSERFDSIIKDAGPEYELNVKNLPKNDLYIIACSIILKSFYGYNIDFRRPFLYEIPDSVGRLRQYKILYNADFVEFVKTDKAPDISEEDYIELLDNFDDIDLWKAKFPSGSYIAKGFILNNLFEVTQDHAISEIKSTLLEQGKRKNDSFIEEFQTIFRSLFDLPDIQVGFNIYNKENHTFEKVASEGIDSYLLQKKDLQKCGEVLCTASTQQIIEQKKYYAISDVDRYYRLSEGKSPQYKILHEQGIKSALFAPISYKDELLALLELVSKNPHDLNSINAMKLDDVMPYIITAVLRSKAEEENLIEAIIQQECTTIHESVYWRFRDASRNFLRKLQQTGRKPMFEDIVFDHIYPLFGQMDVKGSSDARNVATQKDLSLQLTVVSKILDKILDQEKLPIYEKYKYQVESYVRDLKNHFKVDSEHEISMFLKEDIGPVFKFLLNHRDDLKEDIDDYFSKIDDEMNHIYYYRKNYDDTITMVNETMSSLLDARQLEAQKMYPHYYERYKTDGVEHNMYIGESITKEKSFDEVYLYNLRLWQLQVMCDMENEYYKNQHDYPLALDVASMILVFGNPLSIRFRMDEKQFDVDGTYNARYEVVKKRIDKAFIKGTEERITQKGKITIIYSQKEDEQEYLEYIKFLQSKQILDKEIEILEIQDLQSVTGLKALRVKILYKKDDSAKQFYTYDDLMAELNS